MVRLTVGCANCYWRAVSGIGLTLALLTSTATAQSDNQGPAYTYNSTPTTIPGVTPEKKSWYQKAGDSLSNGWKATTGVVKGAAKGIVPRKKPRPDRNDAVHLDGNKGLASADLHAEMAAMFLEQGQNDRAIKHFEQAFKLEPNNLKAIRGYARYLQSQNKPLEAEKQIRRAIKLNANSPGAWNDLGICLAQQGRRAEAVRVMEHAIRLRPKKVLYRNNVAAVLMKMGETERAFTHLTQAHGNAKAHYNVGYLLVQTGQRQEAAAHFSRALQLDSSMVASRQWLAQLNGRPSPERLAQRPITVLPPVTRQGVAPRFTSQQPPSRPPAQAKHTAANQFWGQTPVTQNARTQNPQWQVQTSPPPSSNVVSATRTPQTQTQPRPTGPIRVAPTPTSRGATAPTAEDRFWGQRRAKPVNQSPLPSQFGTRTAPTAASPRIANRTLPPPVSTPAVRPPAPAAVALPSQQFEPYKLGSAPTPGPAPSFVSDSRFAPKPSTRYKSPLKFGKQRRSSVPPSRTSFPY